LLGLTVGGSLALYAWRAPRLAAQIRFAPASRESAILLNNVLLGALCFAVLTGTLYPLILDALGGGKISVGEPYFNFLFAVLGAPLALLIGVGALLRWKRDRGVRVARRLLAPAVVSVALGFAWPVTQPLAYSVNAALGLSLGCWVALSAWVTVVERGRGDGWRAIRRAPAAVVGMSIAHFGVGVFIIGVTFTHAYSVEKDLRLARGEVAQVGGYAFRFDGVFPHRGPNYDSARGEFVAGRDGDLTAVLRPEKRTYLVQQNPMTEAAIDAGFTRDLYVALGEALGDVHPRHPRSLLSGGGDGDVPPRHPRSLLSGGGGGDESGGGAWSVRIYYKPFIRWIWLGALLMATGGVIAACDKRYRRRAESTVTESTVTDSTVTGDVTVTDDATVTGNITVTDTTVTDANSTVA